MNPYNIKFLTADKLETIIPLYQGLDSKLSSDVIMSRLKDLMKTDYKILVAYSDQSPVPIAMVGLSYNFKLYCGAFMELHHMVVGTNWRNKGVGTQLLCFVESYARMRDVNVLALDSYHFATDAHALYEKHGYKSIGNHFLKPISVV
jgi:GNAT superfamily N-acetyltransferase